MKDLRQQIVNTAKKAKDASRKLAIIPREAKDKVLILMAEALLKNKEMILSANQKDVALARKANLSLALIDRLTLNEKRIAAMASSIKAIAGLACPVNEIIDSWQVSSGLVIRKISVPIGVIAIIYESRPNVTSDCVALCLKSGNSLIMRGGKEALNSNSAIYNVLEKTAVKHGMPYGAINLITDTDRSAIRIIVEQAGLIDLVMPRGGEALINEITRFSKVPVIKHYKGICHVYVDKAADLKMAENISFNAKVQRPGVCNAMETLLVHKAIAKDFLPLMLKKFSEANVEIRGCAKTKKIAPGVKSVKESDWSTEYLDLILSVKVVDSLDDAITHINKYGSMHSDSIVTKDKDAARQFLNLVDSSCVYVNASTRFTDGAEFGFGAEIGISTEKLHARGPMALKELTTYKYHVVGNGQVRK